MTPKLAEFVFVTCLAFTGAAAAAPPSIPTAVYRDPRADKTYRPPVRA